ncbi:uncharacterized protein [Danio rerio]|uniref:HIT domain-containing protein n=1 Tax=Danio rerio TaxID=7955 RepID=A0A8N7UV06_DANRE
MRRWALSGSAVSLILNALLGRMSWALQEPLVIWESADLLAYLHPSPWTPGVAVLTCKSPCAGGLFHLPEDLFLRLLLGARSVSRRLCAGLSVQRCALVHTPQKHGNTQLLIVPLHGLSADWRPHLAADEEFNEFDPGYISSKSGPRWTDDDLEAVKNRICKPSAQQNYTFLGDPSDDGLFPRIIRGEAQQWRVWEDDEHVAFLTPFPNSPGLTVLVPRRPLSSDVLSLQVEEYKQMVLATREVSCLLEAGLGAWGVGLIFEGFEIDYAHAKLIPLVCADDGAQMSPCSSPPELFQKYPGFVTSLSGPAASRGSLKEIHDRITHTASVDCND